MDAQRFLSRRATLVAHAEPTTSRWHQCKPFFPKPAVAVSGLCSLDGWPSEVCSAAHASASALTRKMTWEDGLPSPSPLPASVAHLLPRAPLSYHGISRPSILEWDKRIGNACNREWFCQHWQLPLALNTTHRAAPAFVMRGRAGPSWLGLMIPKCGTTTLDHFVQAYNLTSWTSPRVLQACATLSYRTIVQLAHDAALEQRATIDTISTSCGHAATFDLPPSQPSFSVAFVRDPIRRFISAIEAHSQTTESISPAYVRENMGLFDKDIGRNVSSLDL